MLTAKEIREMAKDIAYCQTIKELPLTSAGYKPGSWRHKADAEGREVGKVLGEIELNKRKVAK